MKLHVRRVKKQYQNAWLVQAIIIVKNAKVFSRLLQIKAPANVQKMNGSQMKMIQLVLIAILVSKIVLIVRFWIDAKTVIRIIIFQQTQNHVRLVHNTWKTAWNVPLGITVLNAKEFLRLLQIKAPANVQEMNGFQMKMIQPVLIAILVFQIVSIVRFWINAKTVISIIIFQQMVNLVRLVHNK